MHSDRVIIFIRQMGELASELSELEWLRSRLAEAQQRALAGTVRSQAVKSRAKLLQ